MDLEQRLAALEEADKQKTLLIQAQEASILSLASENAVQRRALEAQQRLVGELSNSIFPEGHWTQDTGEAGKPAAWQWSLERYKIMTSSHVNHATPISLSVLPIEVLKQIVRFVHPSRATLVSLCLVSFHLFEIAAVELYTEFEIDLDTAPLLFLKRKTSSKKAPTPEPSPRIQPYLNLSTIQTLILSPQLPSRPPPSKKPKLTPGGFPYPSSAPSLSLSRTRTGFMPLPLPTLLLRSPRTPHKDLKDWEDVFKLVDPETWRFEGPEPIKDDFLSPRLQLLESDKVSIAITQCMDEWDCLKEVVFKGKSVFEADPLKRALERLRKGRLEYTLVSKDRNEVESIVKFGAGALADQLELAGKVGAKRKKGEEIVDASLTLRVVAV